MKCRNVSEKMREVPKIVLSVDTIAIGVFTHSGSALKSQEDVTTNTASSHVLKF